MQHKILNSVIVLLLTPLLGCSTNSDYVINDFNKISALMEFHNVPGVSIAIIKDFKIDQLLVYGVKNQDTLAPVTNDTLFQAASISKSVASVAVMKMSQNGIIDIDEDINNKLISWNVEENEFTIEHKATFRKLLSHTAGTTVHGFHGYSQNDEIPSLVEILNGQTPANSPAIVVDNTPGNTFEYSGGGFVIAQQALIDVTQQPFEDLMNDTVLEPLGMTSSSYKQLLSGDKIARTSAGHDSNGNNILADYNIYPEMSAAGLWTTPQDLAKFLIELQLALLTRSNKVLTDDAVEEMITPTGGPVFNSENIFYGLGFMIWKQGDEIYFGHGGANKGFRSRMMAHNKLGMGYVVMTNGENGEDVIQEIVSLISRSENHPS